MRGWCERRPEDGYRLWLRYERLADVALRARYRRLFRELLFTGCSPVLEEARAELVRGLSGLLAAPIRQASEVASRGTLVVGTAGPSGLIAACGLRERLRAAGDEGFVIARRLVAGKLCTVIAANRDVGVLHGIFHLLRQLGVHRDPDGIEATEAPRIRCRMLNHWDNLDGTVERGYAGASLWEWDRLPGSLSPRYRDYARANASIGINGTVLNNVNADSQVLSGACIAKAAALAGVFRRFGIRVYLSARFSAPMDIGGLATADPTAREVAAWWRAKAEEIYRAIPDFGGLLVKAGSEGQPGPQDYGRTHADGANLLADALAPHGGTVIWRAFVYRSAPGEDRAKQAFGEFAPLDGEFRPNVLVQVKNGPIDFQPREPFHPLFGAMPRTPLALELQITQEYLGFSTHLAYLAPLFKEVLDADTYCRGPGTPVSGVVDGTLDGHAASGIAGVANTGSDHNWCGHPFAAANWYAFGRLAWDHTLSPAAIADEWIRMTFTTDERVVGPVRAMMLASREAVVDYMTPLGLHHLMGWGHHHGPAPWISEGRADWTPVYFHRADRNGIGFDRGSSGSNAASQYRSPLREQFADAASCPEELLLWFHHVGWDRRMRSGRTLWEELCHRYQRGVDTVRSMRRTWRRLAGLVDRTRFHHVRALLAVQEREAVWWRDACLAYFQGVCGRPFPEGVEPPAHPLQHYVALQDPGNQGRAGTV